MKQVSWLGALVLTAACSSTSPTRTPEPVLTSQPVPAPAQPNPEATPAPAPTATAQFTERCLRGLERAKAMRPALVAVKGPRTVDNLLEPWNDLLIAVKEPAGLAGVLSNVHPDPELRAAARACEQDIEAFRTSLDLDPELYRAFASLDLTGLDGETRRMVEHQLRDFRRAGVDKEPEVRARIEALEERIVKTSQEFDKNMDEAIGSIELDSVDQLAGLPADFIAAHPPGADGKIVITTKYPDLIPFMTYAESTELRRQLYVASLTRAAEVNDKLLGQLLALRYEKARLLGYADWADYDTEVLMMKSGDKAAAFIDRMVQISSKRLKRDYQELLHSKRKDHPNATKVDPWERGYYENKVKAEKYSFDSQEVRPYFEYSAVEQGLLDVTAEMYGIRFERAADAEVWHEDVKAFDVYQGGDKLGRIFLDMHPRDGKYSHAAQFDLLPGVKGKQLPQGVLVCNFPNPRTAGGAALMEHDDVETMFHEFGHLVHHILGSQRQRWVTQSGIETERDFVEAPSQMFEEWAWSHEILARFAKHHETGKVIPAEMVARMRKARDFGLGVYVRQQMFYASLSLELHRGDPTGRNLRGEVQRLQDSITAFPYVEGTYFHSSFGHLNGYSAHYYTYMWSLVIAKDLLTPFKKHGLMSAEWTARYRDLVLAPGGTKDAADLVADFLGRPFEFKAFESYLAGK